MTAFVRLADNGKISLPATLRRQLGLVPGDRLAVDVEGDELRISSVRARLRQAQRLAREMLGPDYTVDQFLAERREEAERENREL